MMRPPRLLTIPMMFALAIMAGCAARAKKTTAGTLADLHSVAPDVKDVTVENGLDQALEQYRKIVEETPKTAMTPEAMRRLADLQVEKQYGIRTGNAKPREMAAPKPAQPIVGEQGNRSNSKPVASAARRESDKDFERRTTAGGPIPASSNASAPANDEVLAGAEPKGPLDAIKLYDQILTEYPNYEHRDKVLYQKARAYDELGRTEEAIATMEQLIRENPNSQHFDEVQYRRGEYFFTRRRYRDAENAYSAVVNLKTASSYYELALYKLGWTFYKQDMYDEALDKYMALLDYKVSIGYDFDQKHEEEDERRVADTFRVISLSFSNLGGPEAVGKYYSTYGKRPYEARVYSNLGEHYLGELRYQDAAKTFQAFVALYPLHRDAPQFSMRIIETYTKGGFPKLVLESKREFAANYGLQGEYWKHFKPEDSPKVLAYVKTNLKDLATHYHAEYQNAQEASEKLANYNEARRWYGDYLDSFPKDADSPAINYRLADLLLENHDFGEAAKQYERTAYGYPTNPKSAGAGYAAVYAYRQQLNAASPAELDVVKRNTIASSLKFADAFPEHEHAAEVLGAAADDMYEMKDYHPAVEAAQRLIDRYPNTDAAVRRSAWIVVAHGSFEIADYPQAEKAYTEVLAATPKDDKSRPALVDNLAASIYKQGELASKAGDDRAAADHFLRIKTAAPTSTIRPAAEYDAGAALIRLKDWTAAVNVLDAFRTTFPDHKLRLEADKQIAHAYRENGQLANAAVEYDHIASKSDDPALRSEALLVAGDLYEKSNSRDHALDAYTRYVNEFPKPLDTALETRSKIAEMYKAANDDAHYQDELKQIVSIDASAGSERTGRTKTLAARSALVLAERLYQDFVAVKLTQPFEVSLKQKKERMDATIKSMSGLVDYEIADITAAATYYLGETYSDFGQSLLHSEKPTNLSAAELKDFEEALDEQAFPFEEKAINVHEKNIEMLRAGVYNDWTKKSLEKLTQLMPGRYAKPEISIAFLAEIETYAYRSPASQVSAPTTANADTTPGKADPTTNSTPQPLDSGAVKPGTSSGSPVSAPTTGNANMTPGKPDQSTNPTPQPVDNRSSGSPVTAPTTGNANMTPGKSDSTTNSTPQSLDRGTVKPGTSPGSPVAAPTTGNANMTPSKPDPTTNSTPQSLNRGTVKPGTSPGSQVSAPTTGNANTTPTKPDPTTNPTPQPTDKGMVKHGTS